MVSQELLELLNKAIARKCRFQFSICGNMFNGKVT